MQPGTGAPCPQGEVADCAGTCGPERWVGDGVCDAVYACPSLADDGGDCTPPVPAVQIPDFL